MGLSSKPKVKRAIKKILVSQSVRNCQGQVAEADSIYAVYSENTGEPYLFSTTYDRGDEGYLCTDPMIMLFTLVGIISIRKQLKTN